MVFRDGNRRRLAGVIARFEFDGCIEAALERIHGLLRVHDHRARVLKHECGQVIGIGVSDVNFLAVCLHGRRETALLHDLDEIVGDGLRAQTWRDGVQAEPWHRHLRHARRVAGLLASLFLLLLVLLAGDGNRARQIVRGGKNRELLRFELNPDARFVAELEATLGAILV